MILLMKWKYFENEGIEIFGHVFTLKLSVIVCDAPARSFLKAIKGHSSYNLCERCIQQGE